MKLASLAYRSDKLIFEEAHVGIDYARTRACKLNEFYGSYLGAVGQAQFMPSIFLKYAVDGNDSAMFIPSLPDVFHQWRIFCQKWMAVC